MRTLAISLKPSVAVLFPAGLVTGILKDDSATTNGPGTRDVERVIDQRLNALEEAHRVREFGVAIERRFVRPPRVDVEPQRIADGAIGLDRTTAWLFAGRRDDVAQRRRDDFLLAITGMEAGEDEQFHQVLRLRGWVPRMPGADVKP